MLSTVYNISLNQGSYYCLKINLQGKDINGLTVPFDLTGYSVRSQIRRTYDSCDVFPFTATIDDVINGNVTLSLPATVSVNMDNTSYVWDMEVYSDTDTGIVYRPVSGTVTVSPEVTH